MKRKLNLSHPLCFRILRVSFRFVFSMILIQLPAYGLQAQSLTIHGVVSDANGPLPNVSVTVQGGSAGVHSGEDGRYTIQAPGNAVLVFTSVGYMTQQIEVNNRTAIDVLMEIDTRALGEVVVVGYGATKKATVTGAISTISGEQIKAVPSVNFSNSLSGRLPGLVAASRSGEPGNDDALLRIRGSNTLGNNAPLIVVDGIANRTMQRLDPADIESVTVLKDASAAIYGAEAANGVILITTRRGVAGKPKITVNLNQAFVAPTVLPKLTDAATYAQLRNEISSYSGGGELYTAEEIQKFRDGSDPFRYPNTNWINTVFKPSSQQRYGNVSLSGGSEGIRYFVSMGTNYQDGIYRNSATNYSQVDFRSNLDAKVSEHIKVSLDLAGRQENRNYPTVSQATIFDYAINRALPNVVSFYGPGLPGSNFEGGNNPAVIATSQTGYNKNKQYFLMSNLRLEVSIPWIKGLSFTGNAAFDKNFLNDKIWRTPWYLNTWDGSSVDAAGQPVLTKVKSGYADPNLSQTMADGRSTTLNALLNYQTTIAEKHNIKLLAGTEKNTGTLMNLTAYRRYFLSTALDQMFAGGDVEKENGGSASQSARLNYFGRVNYDYRSKYLVEFLFRYDGSYIFPEDKRFGFFPGISVGWHIGREDFWQDNLSFINQFKIRASWGQTGNNRITEYQYLSSMGFADPLVLNGNVQFKTLDELRIANPNVTWEIANQSNIGVDGELLDGKIKFSWDYFYNLRSDILAFRNASVPTSTGLTLPMENIGEVVNRGFEFMVSYGKTNQDFSYEVFVNGGFARNKIKFWDETPGAPEYQKSTGHPMNSNLYYQALGIYRDQAAVDGSPHWEGARPGDIQFKDVNEDGLINGLDRVRDDRSDIPTFTGGLGVNLKYKNIYAAVLIQGAAGAVRYHDPTNSGAIGNFFMRDAEGRWTPENMNASKPRTWNGSGEYWSQQLNTYWLQSTDYARLKTVEIGYSLPKKITDAIGIGGASIYFSGLNLLTLDGLKDFDPESVSNISYPPNKVLNFGLTVTL